MLVRAGRTSLTSMVVGTWCMRDVMYDDLNWPLVTISDSHNMNYDTNRETTKKNTGSNSTSLFAARPNTRWHENVSSRHDAKYSLVGRTTGESSTRNDCKHRTKYDSTTRTKDSNFVPNMTPYKSRPLLLLSLSIRYALCLHNDARTMLKHFVSILSCIRVWSIVHSETNISWQESLHLI